MMVESHNTTTYILDNEDLFKYLNSPSELGIAMQYAENVEIEYIKNQESQGVLVVTVKHFTNEVNL